MKTIFSLLLMSAISFNASAESLSQLIQADCSTPSGSLLKLDRPIDTLEAKFAGLPLMINFADGARMSIEYRKEGNGYEELIALTVNMEKEIMGSIALAAKDGENLGPSATLLAIFRDFDGKVLQENLNCKLAF